MIDKLIIKKVRNEDYIVFPVVSLLYTKGERIDFIDSELRNLNLTPLWTRNKSYLERILEVHPMAEELFGTKEIGLLYFVNDLEPNIPLKEYDFKIGDKIEIVYIKRDWKKENLE